MGWCLESAIGLIFKGVEFLNDKISAANLNHYLQENSKGYDVSGRQISQTVYDLKRRNYIDFGEGDSVILTNKARIKIIDQIVQSLIVFINAEIDTCDYSAFEDDEWAGSGYFCAFGGEGIAHH